MAARSAPGSANAQKMKQMSRAGDGGTAHATGVREGMPLNAILRPVSPSTRAFSLLDMCGVDCSLHLPEWRSFALSEGGKCCAEWCSGGGRSCGD